MPLRPMANRFGGCFCLGSGPVLWFLFCFCRLLRFLRWRNASLAGGFAGRRFFVWLWFSVLLLQSICRLHGPFVLVQGIFCLLSCKDRAISATSATLEEKKISHLNVQSCLISAILAVLLIAIAPEEFGIPECTTTVEAAGLDGPHRWGIILPNSSRVSLLTYKAIVAVRCPELVLHDQDPIQIGHFVPHDHTVGQGGFRTVLWEVPRDSRDLLAAIEDIVVFLNYLQKCYRDLKERRRSSW